jgi:hypothetical protein
VALQKARKPAAESTANGPSELVLLPGKNGSHATRHNGETQTGEQPKPAEHRIDILSARRLRGSGRTVVGNETHGPCWARRHPLAKCRLPVITARTDGGRVPALADAVPSCIECVTVFGDDDDAGRRHAPDLAARLRARGFEVLLKYLKDEAYGEG